MTATVYDFDREADLRSLLDSENLPRVSALAVIDVSRMRLQDLRPYVRVGHTAAIAEVRRRALDSALKSAKGGAR